MEPNYIVFFDGICRFCNASINLLINLDQEKKLKFTSLQSDWAQDFLFKKLKKKTDFQTILYYRNGTFYEKSEAVFQIFRDLNKFVVLTSIFRLIPQRLCDFLYERLAKNRYFLFGKHENYKACRRLTPDEKELFLE
ncbi:Protein of uncharacterised function, DUF393 [Candidatus Ornithobacterium hominis]|uniref:thiol-disulfide oxidoreductase DCC family protein n=1 Tax=Candidatus Ornithobacterium hominis TaxID=2497989 RepID=UPI000E5B77C8|nr:DCC1-like thiol-disulfide oxidoreductase family protein [Candidatus Ornithobacterium hominis]SZD72110.1 Protein of uncharacterised function, DUF393 [Candidatus Ornithobacterium hominis]